MTSDTLILTIAGRKYAMKPDEEKIYSRELTKLYRPEVLVTISDERTGKVYETIRMDCLFNY